MTFKEVHFLLNNQPLVLKLNFDQYVGLDLFILLYNKVNYGTGMDEDETYTIPVPFSIDFRYPINSFEWEDEDNLENRNREPHNINMNNISKDLFFRDWNREMIQGFITGAQIMGVNWRDYIFNFTINGQPVDII